MADGAEAAGPGTRVPWPARAANAIRSRINAAVIVSWQVETAGRCVKRRVIFRGMARRNAVKAALTLDAIAAAALRLIDDGGVDALTYRSLAVELGVAHMTVYRRLTELNVPLDGCVMDYLVGTLPHLGPEVAWAQATRIRFTALYEFIVEHPGIVGLRRDGPWLGPNAMRRFIEPQLAANLAIGMSPEQMVRAYRRMYLFTLGCACFTDHSTPEAVVARTRRAIEALSVQSFPVVTGNREAILSGVIDHEVFHGGLEQLIRAADPRVG